MRKFLPLPVLALSLFLALWSRPAAAQLLTPQLRQALQAEMDRIPPHFGIQGVASAVRLPDGTIWSGAAGTSTDMPLDSLRPDMLFGVASLTKTFTAAMTVRLIQRGRLLLDDSIGPLLPPYARIPNVNPNITIRQLLTHTSGLYNYPDTGPFWTATRVTPGYLFTPQDLLAYVAPPPAAPGAVYEYCNTDYFLLGLIIERNLHKPLATIFRDELWRPTGMSQTFLGYQDSIPPSQQQAHAWTLLLTQPTDLCLAPRTALLSGFNSAGGALSTVSDIARWGKALFGSNRILAASSLQLMKQFSPQSLAANLPYGLGCSTFELGTHTGWGHTGSIPGCLAIFAYEPDCDVSIALVFNDDRIPSLRRAILERLYNVVQQAVCPAPLGVFPPVDLSAPIFGPNPTNGTTWLSFTSPVGTRALHLKLLDATGRMVRALDLDPTQSRHELALADLPAGVYYARLQVTNPNGAVFTGARLTVLP